MLYNESRRAYHSSMETYEKDVMELLRKYEEEADGIDPMDWLYDE